MRGSLQYALSPERSYELLPNFGAVSCRRCLTSHKTWLHQNQLTYVQNLDSDLKALIEGFTRNHGFHIAQCEISLLKNRPNHLPPSRLEHAQCCWPEGPEASGTQESSQ